MQGLKAATKNVSWKLPRDMIWYDTGHFESSESLPSYLKLVQLVLNKAIDKKVHKNIIITLYEMKFANCDYNFVDLAKTVGKTFLISAVSLSQKENNCIF